MVCRVGKRRLVTLSQGVGPSFATIERFGALGDSFTRQMLAQWGASVTKWGFTSRAWAAYAAMLSNRKFWVDPAACEGYSGYRTDQILSSILPIGSTTSFGPSGKSVSVPYGIRSTGVRRVFEWSGTNDVTYYSGGDPATAVSNRRAIWAALRGWGIEPIALSLLPRGDSYNSAVPTWNAAFAAAAAADGIVWVDVWTPCQSGGAWKTGYNWLNGVVDPVSGLHPGADACMLGIAPVLASAVTSALTQTPFLATASAAELRRGVLSRRIPIASGAWDGLFSSAANWPVSEGYASTRSVGSRSAAQIGNALICTQTARATQATTQFLPSLIDVSSGLRYAVFGRMSFTAGVAKPTTSDNADAVYSVVSDESSNELLTWLTGGSNAYSIQGASLPDSDFYFEINAPAISKMRFAPQISTYPASAGTEYVMAQAGIIGPL